MASLGHSELNLMDVINTGLFFFKQLFTTISYTVSFIDYIISFIKKMYMMYVDWDPGPTFESNSVLYIQQIDFR